MSTSITSELVEAFSLCPRKAFLLLKGEALSVPHEYESILKERADDNRLRFIASLVDSGQLPFDDGMNEAISTISNSGLIAECDALLKSVPNAPRAHARHEPYVAIGTQVVNKAHKLRLAFTGYVVGKARRYRPTHGFIVTGNGEKKRVGLEQLYPTIRSILTELQEMIDQQVANGPPLVLNKHCPVCQFRRHCQQQAEEEDNLSLLARMTPKLMRKYQKKGILTVNQLSYIFKPRRRRKRTAAPKPVFNLAFQALALRTAKVYVHDSPSIPNHTVELFVDIEGIPDQDFNYLIGLVVCTEHDIATNSFWADSIENEANIFQKCLKTAAQYGDGPIYHYGSYEARAFSRAAKKYDIDCNSFMKRLVNINEFVFGKVYFPSRSNSLKDLGRLVGATWSSPEASGLQSLVWRYRWERTHNGDYRKKLLEYNLEDCHALRLLTGEIRDIGRAGDSRSDVDFTDAPKQHTTAIGAEVHSVFEEILESAHAQYQRKRIRLRPTIADSQTERRKTGAPKGCRAIDLRRIPSKAGKVIRVPRRRKCTRCKGQPLQSSDKWSEHTLIDLAFTRNGCRKTIIRHVGIKAYCPHCCHYYVPPAINRIKLQVFGHRFQAWTVYQRVALRLPFDAIVQEIEDLFGETIHKSTVTTFLKQLAERYSSTEDTLMRRILQSPFIHVDETKLSIRGVQHYVWVMTNGTHVVFRMTETRETTLIRKILDGYGGVLITDFYAGYDSVKCRQQKCLVHLIRDLNDDLWGNPFNEEFELFSAKLRDVLVPMFEDVQRYGLKTRHLRKHKKLVDRFYRIAIDADYQHDTTRKYQQRFLRYRDSLFLFLEQNGIPWNNNMAERAIRHLAVQRKISGSFGRTGASQYLRFLGIHQTCRFQGKSFLKFLLSEEKDVDDYKERIHRLSKNRKSQKQ